MRRSPDLGVADHGGPLSRRGEVCRCRSRPRPLPAHAPAGDKVGGHPIVDLVTVNGVRVVTDDGTWGLVRASSNKPELVVVIESPVSEARMREMFAAVDAVLREEPSVGALQPDDLIRPAGRGVHGGFSHAAGSFMYDSPARGRGR